MTVCRLQVWLATIFAVCGAIACSQSVYDSGFMDSSSQIPSLEQIEVRPADRRLAPERCPAGTSVACAVAVFPISAGGTARAELDVLVAANLFGRIQSRFPLGFLQIRARLLPGMRPFSGDLFLWKRAAEVPAGVAGWESFSLPAQNGGTVAGMRFRLPELVVDVRSGERWVGMIPALRQSGITGRDSTWLIMGDPQHEHRFVELLHIRPEAKMFLVNQLFTHGQETSWSAFRLENPWGRGLVLPRGVTFKWERDPLPQVFSHQTTAVNGERLNWRVSIEPIPGLDLPHGASGHWFLRDLELRVTPQARHRFEVRAWRWMPGPDDLYFPEAPITIASGVLGPLSPIARIDLSSVEPSTPQRFGHLGEAKYYVRAVTVRFDDSEEIVVFRARQGFVPRPINGHTFPF